MDEERNIVITEMRMIDKLKLSILFLFFISFHHVEVVSADGAPYPASQHIKGIVWDFENQVRKAPGSDLWPVTWGADDHLFTSWGDGGGFGGTNSNGRVSLGFARMEGPPYNFKAVNIWGGYNAENTSTFEGKCAGIVSVDGILYAWINMQNGNPPDVKLAWSKNFGKKWQLSEWAFSSTNDFFPCTFLNYGRDNAGSRDDYIYSYGGKWIWAQGAGDHIYMARVKKDAVKNRSAYYFFAGKDDNGEPVWTRNIEKRKPVFTDSKGVGNCGLAHVVFNPRIERYILAVGHRSGNLYSKGEVRCLGIFDASDPWGPWTTVAYYEDWGGYGSGEALGYVFPTKWISEDGKTMWMIYSSEGKLDSFNLVKADLILP
jgi:hypothetical protein